MKEELIVRKYTKKDRASIRDIAFKTAFMGEPGSIFFASQELLSSFLTEGFTDYEPESSFVAERNCKVIGYLLGTKDTKALINKFKHKILPRLLRKFIFSGALFKRKNITFLLSCLRGFLTGEFYAPGFSREFPASLNINIEREFRNYGIGSRLIATYLDYLRIQNIPGVSFATMSIRAAHFFTKAGFRLLYEGRRSYFRHILKKDIPIYIYGMRLL